MWGRRPIVSWTRAQRLGYAFGSSDARRCHPAIAEPIVSVFPQPTALATRRRETTCSSLDLHPQANVFNYFCFSSECAASACQDPPYYSTGPSFPDTSQLPSIAQRIGLIQRHIGCNRSTLPDIFLLALRSCVPKGRLRGHISSNSKLEGRSINAPSSCKHSRWRLPIAPLFE